MWNTFNHPGFSPAYGLLLVPLFFLWVAIAFALKGYTLWHSAKRGDLWWFIALLIINSMGILELVYIFVIMKKRIDFRKKGFIVDATPVQEAPKTE